MFLNGVDYAYISFAASHISCFLTQQQNMMSHVLSCKCCVFILKSVVIVGRGEGKEFAENLWIRMTFVVIHRGSNRDRYETTNPEFCSFREKNSEEFGFQKYSEDLFSLMRCRPYQRMCSLCTTYDIASVSLQHHVVFIATLRCITRA